MLLAQIILWIVAVYAGIGVLFALAFICVGVARVDPSARAAPIGFRLLIIPGSAALWPILLVKWLRSQPTDGGHS